MRRLCLLIAFALASALPAAATAASCDGDARASIGGGEVRLGNGEIERSWTRDRLSTLRIEDRRTGAPLAGPSADLALVIDGARVTSDLLPVASVRAEGFAGGCRLVWRLLADEVIVERTVELPDAVAGFLTRTTLLPLAPAVLSGYDLERVGVGDAATTIHAFRAGADWRSPEWAPSAAIGDPHRGEEWRIARTAAPGEAIEGNAQWLSADTGSGTIGLVLERRNYASSRMGYATPVASASVDLSRDLVYFGPIEENAHAENPGPGPGRRALAAGEPVVLEPVYTVAGLDADDEAWQFHELLTRHRLAPYPKHVTFNTNNVDRNAISTGAKDDVDFARFTSLARAAHEMGVETFILDDGWQARSGDWCPDSPACPEPRWDGTPGSRFRPRFPDATFDAVRALLRDDPATPADEPDMDLGLWWTPMEFHPSSNAFTTNPQWSCMPVGTATAVPSYALANGSWDAGIGVWNPAARGSHPDDGSPATLDAYIEGRIARAIEVYGARYFKFDFLVWIDCLGVDPVDMYAYHDRFVAMVDRLQARYPHVTFQVDETNDYRMFPFESVARGPSWFQNGSPPTSKLLYNLWNLAPFVPGFSIGQGVLGGNDRNTLGIDTVMAAALGSHITFWTEIDALTPAQRAQVRRWTDFYRAHRDALATFTYPLGDDPRLRGWTALQPWDPETRSGFLLAYRQASPDAVTVFPLRGIGDGAYRLTRHDPASGSAIDAGTVPASVLRSGLIVDAPLNGYAIYRIEPV